jgi:pimeloyl-ACP methyl ester carboxylesterase
MAVMLNSTFGFEFNMSSVDTLLKPPKIEPSSRPPLVPGTVRSADGTEIGFLRLGLPFLGSGPSLVIVHGSLATKEGWLPVANLLAQHFTCFVMDRRGRGSSGDHEEYSVEREYEDVEAVVRAAGPDAYLLGHSFGAVCSLGAALRVPVRKLVLYEPPMPTGGPIAGADLEVYRRAIEEGAEEEALELGLLKFAGIAPAQIESLRATRLWPRLTALAAGWTREIEAIEQLGTAMGHYSAIAAPTLLIVGSETRYYPTYSHPIAALLRVSPDIRLTEIQGHGHLANMTAPEVVAERVRQFLQS